jgi:hypothetical protein
VTTPRPILPQVPGAGRRASEQAKEHDSVFAPMQLELDGGATIEVPPHPNLGMLDDDSQEQYEALLFEVDTEYDREPDIYIPEQKLSSGAILPAETRRGDLKRPYRKNGELVRPPHSVRVVQAALGETVYKQLREGGKSAADVWRLWNEQGMRIAERQAADSKSADSAGAVAPLSG